MYACNISTVLFLFSSDFYLFFCLMTCCTTFFFINLLNIQQRNPGLLSRKAKDGSTIVDDEDHREVRRRWAGAQGIMSNAENGNKLVRFFSHL